MAGSPCPRELYYEATGAPADGISDERLMKMSIGAALDEVALRRADGYQTLAHHPVSITMGGLTVRGVADLVFFAAGGPVLVSDLKVVGEETWNRIQSKPKPEHAAQANLYAFALTSPRWSVCYVRAGTGEIHEHFGEMDPFAARRDFGPFEDAAYWIRKGTPPPRPYEDFDEHDVTVPLARDRYPCRFCSHVKTCWEGTSPSNKELRHGEKHVSRPVPA